MSDKRKNNGGKRENAGRKPKADEISMIENMDATKAPIEVWQKLAERVEAGSDTAIKTWLEYRYGKPTQTVNQQMTFNESPAILFKKIDE